MFDLRDFKDTPSDRCMRVIDDHVKAAISPFKPGTILIYRYDWIRSGRDTDSIRIEFNNWRNVYADVNYPTGMHIWAEPEEIGHLMGEDAFKQLRYHRTVPEDNIELGEN